MSKPRTPFEIQSQPRPVPKKSIRGHVYGFVKAKGRWIPLAIGTLVLVFGIVYMTALHGFSWSHLITLTLVMIAMALWIYWNPDFDNNDVRWKALGLIMLLSYGYFIYSAYSGRKSSNPTPQEREFSYLLIPGADGYATKRGQPEGPSNPSLFKWNWSQVLIFVVAVVITVAMVMWFIKDYKKGDDKLVVFIMFAVLWVHTVILLFFLPINPFQKRILYNTRAAAVTVVNDPLKELVAAFVFIVLLPLPKIGGQVPTWSTKMQWLALKVGIFYVFQSLFLGKPNYQVEPPEDEKALPLNEQEFSMYGIIAVLAIVMLVWDIYKTSGQTGKVNWKKITTYTIVFLIVIGSFVYGQYGVKSTYSPAGSTKPTKPTNPTS